MIRSDQPNWPISLGQQSAGKAFMTTAKRRKFQYKFIEVLFARWCFFLLLLSKTFYLRLHLRFFSPFHLLNILSYINHCRAIFAKRMQSVLKMCLTLNLWKNVKLASNRTGKLTAKGFSLSQWINNGFLPVCARTSSEEWISLSIQCRTASMPHQNFPTRFKWIMIPFTHYSRIKMKRLNMCEYHRFGILKSNMYSSSNTWNELNFEYHWQLSQIPTIWRTKIARKREPPWLDDNITQFRIHLFHVHAYIHWIDESISLINAHTSLSAFVLHFYVTFIIYTLPKFYGWRFLLLL